MAFRKNPAPWSRSPLRERDAGQKTNRPEPRLKETFAINGSGSQNLKMAKTGNGAGMHTPEESTRFQWTAPEFGPSRPFYVYDIHVLMELSSDGESSEIGSNTIFMEF